MFQFPPSPTVGQLFTPAPGINYRWNGTAWFPVGAASGGIKISDTEPVITTGEQWYESDTAGHYMRYQNPDGTSTLVSLAGAGGDFIPTAASTTIVPESRIINGNFAIDQRNAGAAVSVSNGVVSNGADRWIGFLQGNGTFEMRRVVYSTEFAASLTVATPAASPGANDVYIFGQGIEGINVADWHWGTPEASAVTFSWHMQSSVAGTFPVSFRNSPVTHSYVKTVTLPANAWTLVTMTIPGPTVGVWQGGNGVGLSLRVCLGAGSAQAVPTVESWRSGNFVSAAGCTNLMATAGAFLNFRSARLYPGSIDYGPCRRLYAEELRLCQRYYEKSYDIDVVPGTATNAGGYGGRWLATIGPMITIPFMVPKRVIPEVILINPVTGATGTWRNFGNNTDTVPVLNGPNGYSSFRAVLPDGTAGHTFLGQWIVNAEL